MVSRHGLFSTAEFFSGNSFFGSSLSALLVLVASLPRYCHCFQGQSIYLFVWLEGYDPLRAQSFQEIQNGVVTVERGILRKSTQPGLKLQLHSCLYCFLFLIGATKALLIDHGSCLQSMRFVVLGQHQKLLLMKQSSLLVGKGLS